MLHSLKQFLKGVGDIDERLKYQAISFIITSVHIMFMVIFFTIGILPLALYNIGAVLFYLAMIYIIGKKSRYFLVFVAIFIEIMLHSAMVTFFIGWECGFMSYTVSLIPLAFYITYTIAHLRDRLFIPVIISVVVFLAYFSVQGASRMTEVLRPGVVNGEMAHKMYLMNMILTFLYIITVSVLFSVEIRRMQYSLETDNISLSKMANFDTLTHLMNRRSMNVQLKQVMDEIELSDAPDSDAFCLMMADIDDFKKVNDTYGHSKGDEVLVEVARVLQSNVREEDKVCRWGGEEMLILLRSNMEVAKNVAQRICYDMESTQLETESGPISVTLTIGVSEYKQGETIRSLIELADKRLYLGKRSGKNCVVWN